MKIKGLIILSIICIIILIMVLLTNPPVGEITPLVKTEIMPTEEIIDLPSTIPAPIIINTTAAPLKSGVTIIKKTDSSTNPGPINEIAASENIDVSNTLPNPTLGSIDNSKTQDNPQMGITTVGKRPTTKESKEMNSQGIVLY